MKHTAHTKYNTCIISVCAAPLYLCRKTVSGFFLWFHVFFVLVVLCFFCTCFNWVWAWCTKLLHRQILYLLVSCKTCFSFKINANCVFGWLRDKTPSVPTLNNINTNVPEHACLNGNWKIWNTHVSNTDKLNKSDH